MAVTLRHLDVPGEFRVVGQPDPGAPGESLVFDALAEVEPDGRMLALLSVVMNPDGDGLVDQHIRVAVGWHRPDNPLTPSDARHVGVLPERAAARLWKPVLRAVADGEVPALPARTARMEQYDGDDWERFVVIVGSRHR
ncbi:MAG: hypothetical protein ACTH0V_05220 [Microbacteriaceae bacterium]